MERFFIRCLPIAFTLIDVVHVSEDGNFFSPNCSAFAVECDWNSKTSQNERKLFFFQKKDVFFEKNLELFQNR